MIRANIDEVTRDMYHAKGEKGKILNAIRQRAYDLYSQGLSEDEVIAGAIKFAKISLDNGKVTKEDVEKEISKVFSINMQNNKTR